MKQNMAMPSDSARQAFERAISNPVFLDSLPIGVFCCDRDGIVRHYNSRATELWGLEPRIGDPVRRFNPAKQLFTPSGEPMAPEQAPMAEVLRTGKPIRDRHIVIERPNGERLLVLVNIDPLFDEQGQLAGAINCFQDISDLTLAREALESRTADLVMAEERTRRSEQYFRDVLNTLPAAVYMTDPQGRITYYNHACVDFSGRTPTLLSDEWCVTWKLYRPDGTPLPHNECPMAMTIRERSPVRGEEAIAERPDGSQVRFAPWPTPLFDADGEMTGAVNMLIDITDRHAAEVESAHLAAIVSSSQDAIVSKTLDGRVRSWNAGATRLFGYEPEEMIGQPILKIIPPELHAEEEEILARLRRGERIEHFETQRVTKDGERVHVSLTVSPVHDKTGRIIGASKVARDITERKRAEEMQCLLMQELNHRVKNTLAIVQSIANQMARNSRSPARFAEVFSGRIQALAHAHSLLTQSAWQGASMLPLIRDQLLVDGVEDSRISFSGPSVQLEPQPALHLALVLHELGTNARKYGALSVPEGRLSIDWEVRSDGGRQLLLWWKESGGPEVAAPTERGFGTTLIERSLAADGGDVSIRYRSQGLECDIMLPLPDRQTAPMLSRNSLSPARASVAPRPPEGSLRKARVLLIEDEPLIAMDMSDTLEEAGCIVVGTAVSVPEALRLISETEFDAALLDANLGGEPVDEVASALTRRGKPFAFVTGYGADALPEAFRQAPLVNKPLMRNAALQAIRNLMARDADILQLRPMHA